MRDQTVYLDSGSLVKRYVEEPGSGIVREAYLKAYSGELKVAFSSWNVGEVLGALDRAHLRGMLDGRDYLVTKSRFLSETRRLVRLGVLRLIPVRLRLLIETWRLLERHHVYHADALQIVSAKFSGASEFFTADKKLHETAKAEGLHTVLTV